MGREYNNPNVKPVGSTFTAASGGNTLGAVQANGTTLNKAQYSALSNALPQDTMNYIAPGTVGSNQLMQAAQGQTLIGATSTFILYGQTTTSSTNNGIRQQTVFFKSTNGRDYSLCSFVGNASETLQKIVTINNELYICTSTRLLKTADGITFSTLYTGLVWDVTYSGTKFLLAIGATQLIETTDFVTFTTRTIPLSSRNVTWFVGTAASYFWIFPNSGNAYYSADGITWTQVTNAFSGQTLPTTNRVFVVNNVLFVCNTGLNGVAMFWFTTTGAAAVLTAAGFNYTTASSVIALSLTYDGTYYVIAGTNVTGVTTIGVRFSTPNGAATNVLNANSGATTSTDTNVVAFNSKIYTYFGAFIALEQTVMTITSLVTNGSKNDGYYCIPFLTCSNSGNTTIYGSTFDGTRYIIKNIFEAARYVSAFVEEGGVFKPLEKSSDPSISTGFYTFGAGALALDASPQETFIYKDASGYIFIHNNATNFTAQQFKITRTPNTDNSSFATVALAITLFVAIPANNVGVYFLRYGTTSNLEVYLLKSSTAIAGNYATITGAFSAPYTFSNITSWCSLLDGTVACQLRNSTTPASAPTIFKILPNQALSLITIRLFTAAGVSVSATNTTLRILRLDNIWYITDQAFVYSSNDNITFKRLPIDSGFTGGALNPGINLQISNYVSFNIDGSYSIQSGQFIFQPHAGGSGGNVAAPSLPMAITIANNGLIAHCPTNTNSAAGITYTFALDPNTEFKVPNISPTTAGQATYIIAR